MKNDILKTKFLKYKMELKQDFFLNSIQSIPDGYATVGKINTYVNNVTAIEDIPLYLAVYNYYTSKLKLVQKIMLDDDQYEIQDLATFYTYYTYSCLFIKVLNDVDNININNYRFFLEFKNNYEKNGIDVCVHIFVKDSFINEIIEKNARIPDILRQYLSDNLINYEIVKPVESINNVELTKPYKRSLFNYQKNNIKWMVDIETKIDNKSNQVSLLYLRGWFAYYNLNGHDIVYNLDARRITKPVDFEYREYHTCGGILADDVGLGKTFSMIGLINERYTNDSLPTLIICPKRLCLQWEDEIKKSCDLPVFTISNITRFKKLSNNNINDYAIYIVPNNLFTNNNNIKYINENNNQFSIENMYWERVILDEGHEYYLNNLKNTMQMKLAIYSITSKYRWICTGTLFNLDDSNGVRNNFGMYNYIANLSEDHFIDINHSNVYNNYKKLLSELFSNFSRKNIKHNVGNEIMIPDPIIDTEFLDQTEKERIIYDSALGDTQKMIELCNHIQVSDEHISILGNKPLTLTEIHKNMTEYYYKKMNKWQDRVLKFEQRETDLINKINNETNGEQREQYEINLNILREEIIKLKDIVNTRRAKYNIFNNIQEKMDTEESCPICLCELDDMMKSITQCGHIMCAGCIQRLFGRHNSAKCPMCRNTITKNKIQIVKQTNESAENLSNVEKWGTKMARMIEYLSDILTNVTTRVIIFSKWDNMLKIIERILTECDFKYTFINGSVHSINKKVNLFKKDSSIRIALLSSDKSASGLNLIEANHIILLDTLNDDKNAAKVIEDQAIGRSVRIGQEHQVNVKRFIMRDTIEHEFYNKIFN